MDKRILLQVVICSMLTMLFFSIGGKGYALGGKSQDVIKLPDAKHSGSMSIERALHERRSLRDYKNLPLRLHEVSQLLWAAQGITNQQGFRTAPSAGALYPLEVYVVVGNVNNLLAGVYKYNPQGHELMRIAKGDKRAELSAAALGQPWVKEGAAAIIFSAVYERTTQKYGERGIRYVHIEAGHAAQNVFLQAVSLNIGAVIVGAFDDKRVKSVVRMSPQEEPLLIMPVGRK